jgi:5'-nucleotidase (lipoprotein e(P4) family)
MVAAAGGAATVLPLLRGSAVHAGSVGEQDTRNPLLWAVAWKETAAEYRALCHQAFNVARMQLDLALARHRPGDRPLAVVSDMDDTILHVGAYWGELISRGHDFFDDELWDAWIPRNLVTAAPGSLEFFRYAAERGVEVFYVTQRDQGEGTLEYALGHLRHLEFPFADAGHLTVFRESSDKEPARRQVAERFEIVLLLGDNLNDFRREYYVADVEERIARMEADRELFGRRFIVLPNPTDGHWVRAIFGDSEPAPTDENRRLLLAAAMRSHRPAG